MCAIAVLYVVKCLQARYEVKDILQVWYEKSPLACKINRIHNANESFLENTQNICFHS